MTHECILTCAYVIKTVNRNLHSNEMRLTDRYNVNTCICPCNNFRDILHKKASVSVHNYPQGLVTISPPSTLKTTQRRNLKCQIFMQTFFKIVLYWCLDLIRHNIGTKLKPNKYIFDISIPFCHHLYLSATLKQYFAEFAVT